MAVTLAMVLCTSTWVREIVSETVPDQPVFVTATVFDVAATPDCGGPVVGREVPTNAVNVRVAFVSILTVVPMLPEAQALEPLPQLMIRTPVLS
ncbi:hypothetical protein CELD12_15860 [Cellulomonas sp. NTE-D12]|nr:hypothetical protein CELD12_15860 [Cellulomonas sp. NTE-D12]